MRRAGPSMLEQIAKRHRLAFFAGPRRDPVAHAIVQPHPAARDFTGDQRRGADDLGQRGEVVDRVAS